MLLSFDSTFERRCLRSVLQLWKGNDLQGWTRWTSLLSCTTLSLHSSERNLNFYDILKLWTRLRRENDCCWRRSLGHELGRSFLPRTPFVELKLIFSRSSWSFISSVSLVWEVKMKIANLRIEILSKLGLKSTMQGLKLSWKPTRERLHWFRLASEWKNFSSIVKLSIRSKTWLRVWFDEPHEGSKASEEGTQRRCRIKAGMMMKEMKRMFEMENRKGEFRRRKELRRRSTEDREPSMATGELKYMIEGESQRKKIESGIREIDLIQEERKEKAL